MKDDSDGNDSDQESGMPDEIKCDNQVFDIAFHPHADYLAIGQVDGAVEVYQYGDDANVLQLKNSSHKGSCRGLLFSEDGSRLYSISSDKSIQAIDSSGQQVFRFKKAHKDAINKIASLGESHVFATGDDSGVVKVWDSRTSENASEVLTWNLHKDYVSGLCYNADHNTLLSVGGDMTLCAYDIRSPSRAQQSDEQEAELHCVQDVKGGRKVVCGTDDGVLLIFSWGRWGDCTDRMVGHSDAIDCVLKVDESTILTGSSDGILRAVSVMPNKILGPVGDDTNEFPIEGIRCSRDRRILASYSHDETVRFTNISMFLDGGDQRGDDDELPMGDETLETMDEGVVEMTAGDESDKDSSNDGNNSGDDDSDSEDEIDKIGRRKFPTANEKFFEDL